MYLFPISERRTGKTLRNYLDLVGSHDLDDFEEMYSVPHRSSYPATACSPWSEGEEYEFKEIGVLDENV
jgi:hypothetical protein